MAQQSILLMVGTRKGAFFLKSDSTRRAWRLSGPIQLGQLVHHVLMDPRDSKTMVMAAKPGHLGPTVFRSKDRGKTWKEASKPPAFPEGSGLAVEHVFWLTPGLASEPGVWWAGTSPPGLFRSEDGGDTWQSVDGFNLHPDRAKWITDAPPDGATMHSINVDPRDARHLYLGTSPGGVFESRDAGATWTPWNRGCEIDFLPGQELEYGHDPHCVRLHPLQPDRLYQQNHCGIYRIDRGEGERWQRIGRNMPKTIGDIGFPIELHPRDPNTAWVFPMDGTGVWPRTSPGGKPALYVTRDSGKRWSRQDKGLPPKDAWFTVKRQALAADSCNPLGLYFGTTSGEIWASRSEGSSWKQVVAHLPHIYSVEAAVL